MIKYRDIEEKLTGEEDKKYIPMIRKVNIPNFVKCVAVWSSIEVDDLCETTLIETLIKWAKEKYLIYEKLEKEIKVSSDFEYKPPMEAVEQERKNELNRLSKIYPVYTPWLTSLRSGDENKISENTNLSFRGWAETAKIEAKGETKITSFFKRSLEAPEELVTAIAALFDNSRTVKSKLTLSIDPVDMLLASENPYNWTSCYKLDRGECFADGCMAAIVDSASLIAYIGEESGDLSIVNNNRDVQYKVSKVAYKRMRQWVAVNDYFDSVCINALYPDKTTSIQDELNPYIFNWLLGCEERELNERNISRTTNRIYSYGYSSELLNSKVYGRTEAERINIYDNKIPCFCGCKGVLPEKDELYDTMSYNSEGFNCENYFEEEPYCEIAEERCGRAFDICRSNCSDCSSWRHENGIFCPYEDSDDMCIEVEEASCENCEDCSVYQAYMEEQEDDEDLDDDSERLNY